MLGISTIFVFQRLKRDKNIIITVSFQVGNIKYIFRFYKRKIIKIIIFFTFYRFNSILLYIIFLSCFINYNMARDIDIIVNNYQIIYQILIIISLKNINYMTML